MSRDSVDTSIATELLKEMLKLNVDGSAVYASTNSGSSSISDVPSTSANAEANSTLKTISNADLLSKQAYVNGKTCSQPESCLMNPESENGGEMESQQQIVLTASEDRVSHRVNGIDVNVVCHKSNHTSGSSKVKISNIVNSVWESRYYFGQLVAAHLSKNYIAYAIKIPTSEDGVVRVISRRTNGRLLLRGMKGFVADLSFAHISSEVILGIVDEHGNIFVYSIKEEGSNLSERLVLEVRRSDDDSNCRSRFRRLIWCPFVPEEQSKDEDLELSDCAKMMVVTYAMEAEIWNVDTVSKEYGCGPLSTDGISEGYQHIKEHVMPVTDASFPPDGSALATSSDDGSVKFFQVGSLDTRESQTCLHNWIPHNGKPLSCLFFLDNKKYLVWDVKYWKYAITGCDQNRELKVWNCASWKCLQTIRFESPEDMKLTPQLQARLDESAEFLILSNITHRVLYVLHIYQDKERNIAKVVSISEFPVTHPVLSFDILDVGRKRLKQNSDEEQMEDFSFNETLMMEDFSEEAAKCDNAVDGLVVKLVCVQPKSLQECVIAFQPLPSYDQTVGSISSMSQDSLYFKDKLSDASFDTGCVDVASGSFDGKQRSAFGVDGGGDSFNVESSMNSLLLTPDVFTLQANETSSPVKSGAAAERSVVNLEDLPSPSSSLHMSPSVTKPSDNTQSKSCSPKDDEDQVKKRDSLKSTGSSPSLEVQEILNKSLVDEIVEDTSDELQLNPNNIETEGGTLLLDSMNQAESLNNLMSLVSGSAERSMKDSAFGASPTVLYVPYVHSRVPEEFSKKPRTRTSWPTTTTIPQHSVASEESRDSPTSKSSKVAQAQDRALFERVSANMVTVTQSMQNVLRLLDSQQVQLNTLKDGMADLQSGRSFSKQMKMLGNFQKDLSTSVKSLLEKHHHAETSIISGLLKSHEDKAMTALTQIASNVDTSRLDGSVKLEFQNSVLPLVTREMKYLESVIHSDLTHSLATTDSLLRDNLSKLVESKTFLSSVCGAVADVLHGSIRSIFQELMATSVVPVFERLCHNMFNQINEAFKIGTKEYIQHLDANVEKEYRQTQELVNDQIQNVISKVQLSTEHLTSCASSEMNGQLQATLKTFEEQMSSRMTALLKEQMSMAMKEHQTVIGNTVVNAIRSRTVTPVPTDFQITQSQVLHLATQGQINAAFMQALSVNDLGLVIFLCEKLSPSQIFNQVPCPLQPAVLLALIGQLSADLESHTELKHEYLKEAVVNLDFADPIISKHSPRVLEILRQKLQQYIQVHPSNKMTRDLRLLLMATTSFLKPNLP